MSNDGLRSCGKRTYTDIDVQNMKVEVDTKTELDPTSTNGCVHMPHSPKSCLLSLNWKQLRFPSVQRIMTAWAVNLWQFECISQQVREVKLQQQLLCWSSSTESFTLKLVIVCASLCRRMTFSSTTPLNKSLSPFQLHPCRARRHQVHSIQLFADQKLLTTNVDAINTTCACFMYQYCMSAFLYGMQVLSREMMLYHHLMSPPPAPALTMDINHLNNCKS